MSEETKKPNENTVAENLSAVGQMILGELESLGGILTADPITHAEGDFNVNVGAAHQKSNRQLTATEPPPADEENKSDINKNNYR